jgi:hypothetical protein
MPDNDENQTALGSTDHIPTDFTLESLQAVLSEEEIEMLNTGDDPLFPSQADTEALAAAQAAELAAQEAAAVAAAAPVVEQAQTFEYPDTSDAEQVLKTSEEQLAAIEAKFDDGDLTESEFREQQRQIIQSQARAQVVIENAQAEINRVTTARRDAFRAELESFKSDNEVLWSDDHLKGWDQALRSVTGNAAYAARPFSAQIALARDLYAANHRALTGEEIAGLAKAKTAKANETERKGPRTDERDEAITTLAGMNGDDTNLMDDGEFAAVDRMMDADPIKAEAMVNKFSAEKLQRYLESAQ